MLVRLRLRLVCSIATILLLAGADARAQTTPDAVSPGTLLTYSTIHSIGLEWDVTGDADHDAIVTLEYRVAGASAWAPALPLVRVDYNGRNMLAGSLLFLAPDTNYDVRVALSDPDGGSDVRTTTVRTRRVPSAPTIGRTFHV